VHADAPDLTKNPKAIGDDIKRGAQKVVGDLSDLPNPKQAANAAKNTVRMRLFWHPCLDAHVTQASSRPLTWSASHACLFLPPALTCMSREAQACRAAACPALVDAACRHWRKHWICVVAERRL
jgi:hypothetical protein